jgi:glycosyltransferase involved in cell wall biosynthesis
MRHSILYINTPTYTGGAEISLLTLMRNLNPERSKPLLLTSGEGQLTETARRYGIETRTQDFPWFRKRYPWRYPASIIKLILLIWRENIDLVHSNCDRGLPYLAAACRWARRPFVAHVRDFDRTWYEPNKVIILNRAARVIANSQAIAAACISAGVIENKIHVIYNPIDVSRFADVGTGARRTIREHLDLAGEDWIVGIVGQIRAEKGHEELLRAAQEICAYRSDVCFLVVGASYSDEDRLFQENLRTQVARLGLEHVFRFVGFQENVATWMRAIDVLAVPSWQEPFGRVVVEGLSAGCAVVATAVGGIPEIITHEQTGLLISPYAPEQLAQSILRLINDVELRKTLRVQGQLRAKVFSVEKHILHVQSLYDSVLHQDEEEPL